MRSIRKVQIPQTSQDNQSHLPTIIMKPLPLPNATTSSPCLMLVNWLIRSPPNLLYATLPYPYYIPSTSHTHANPLEAAHPSFLLQTSTILTATLSNQYSAHTCTFV